MLRHRGFRIVFPAVLVSLLIPSAAPAAVWVTLAAGLPGAVDPTGTAEFQFSNPSGSSDVVVNQLIGTGTVRAATGGGDTFFGSLGTPVVLTLADGSAYVSGGSPPAGATGRGPGGSAGTPSSTAPQTGIPIPSAAALLGLTLGDAADGRRPLTVSVSDGAGTVLGSGSLSAPLDGWWVIGLGPAADPKPAPSPGPTPDPGPGDTGGTPTPSPGPTPGNGVPEPATVALVTSGLVGVLLPGLRRARRGG
jgi:hypothetical protein